MMKYEATYARGLAVDDIVVIREPTVMQVVEVTASRESAGWQRVTYHVLHPAHAGDPVYSYSPKHILDKVIDHDEVRDLRYSR